MKAKRSRIFALGLLITPFFFLSCGEDKEEEPALSYEEQLAIDVEIIDQYLANNSITAEVDTASELRYVIHEQGDGTSPNLGSNIVINYEGRLMSNGTVFDSGDLDWPLNRLIRGWQIGVPKIAEGGSITLYIPSGLAYGPGGQGSILPNSNLIFDIELLEVY